MIQPYNLTIWSNIVKIFYVLLKFPEKNHIVNIFFLFIKEMSIFFLISLT